MQPSQFPSVQSLSTSSVQHDPLTSFPSRPTPDASTVVPFSRSIKRTKRPRIISSGTDTHIAAPKRLKQPYDQRMELAPNATPNSNYCIFCRLPGDLPECEGKLFGPFSFSANNNEQQTSFHAHRNCALWAPEVFFDKHGNMKEVEIAHRRSKKKKCMLCGDYGASLACSYRGASCCRPMHFRCALMGGASLRNGYEAFCPRHAKCSRDGKSPPPSMDVLLDRTPILEELITPGHGCKLCPRDSYDTECGAILTCSICAARYHSKCIVPDMGHDGTFAALSWKGMFYCKNCMRCASCELPVDSLTFSPDLDEEADECDTIKCIGCSHFAIHIKCLPESQQNCKWRCEACRICRHCSTFNVPIDEWSETYEACPDCTGEIKKGGAICPLCSKVYRDGENIPMVQCDYCDKWIHSDTCGGMSHDKFLKIGRGSKRYRCPICTEQKKSEDQRKRRRGSFSRQRADDHSAVDPKSSSLVFEESLKQTLADQECDVVFNVITKVSNQSATMSRMCDQLGVGTDICRHCCSRGDAQGLLYCTDCGEGYHSLCNEVLSKPIAMGKQNSFGYAVDSLGGAMRVYNGKTNGHLSAWQCVRCERFSITSSDNSTSFISKKTNGIVSNSDTIVTNGLTERVSTSVSTKSDKPWVHRRRNGSVHRSLIPPLARDSDPPCFEPISWVDHRKCCLCSEFEFSSVHEGRLVPWGSKNMTDSSHIWIHVGCAMWSSGVTVCGSGKRHTIMLGSRKVVVGQARRTACVLCNESGASIRCTRSSCIGVYHYNCAKAVGVSCGVQTISGPCEKPRSSFTSLSSFSLDYPSSTAKRFCVFCPSHSELLKNSVNSPSCIADGRRCFDPRSIFKIVDRSGSTADVPLVRRRPLSADRTLSLRIGSLSVLKFGRLIPEVNDFIVNKCLVPLGYCAARIFWSIMNPTQRCVYFLEVCGHVQSGPRFVIRCGDAPQWKIESHCPNKAWSEVVEIVKNARGRDGMNDPVYQSIRTSGLEVFGLLNCVPVVTHIESLPTASLFNGRYDRKRVVSGKSSNIIFYNALAKRYSPVNLIMNSTGSARTEGYFSKRWVGNVQVMEKRDIPTYENARTGAAFQLKVAREMFHGKEQQEADSIRQAKKYRTISNTRNAKTKSTAHLSFAAEHQGIAASSKQRTAVLRSDIDGWGVFATKDIPAGHMIIEYVGEVIRPSISDIRERWYSERGIGCYMFEIVPGRIVDATLCGNAARYINHSCAPNCYSKTIKIDQGRHVVVIIAKRRIQRGEELCYDYKFPLDDSDKKLDGGHIEKL